MAIHLMRLTVGRFGLDSFVCKYKGCAGDDVADSFWNMNEVAQPVISFTLKNASRVAVANTVVRYAAFDYGTNPENLATYMNKVQSGLVTTNGSGVFTTNYRGTQGRGGSVYVVLFHPHSSPTESMAWKVTLS